MFKVCNRPAVTSGLVALHRLLKGNAVNIPQPGRGACSLGGGATRRLRARSGNATEPRDTGAGPGKSYLFFLTVTNRDDPGIGLTGEGVE